MTWIGAYYKKFSKENHIFAVCFIVSISGVVHGFLTVQSQLFAKFEGDVFASHFDNNHSHETIIFNWKSIPTNETLPNNFYDVFSSGEIVGALLSFLFSDGLGRKYTLLYSSTFCAFLLVWFSIATNPTHILMLRFLIGWSLGMLLATAPLYCSEISFPARRGQSIGIYLLCSVGGCLLGYVAFVISPYHPISWRINLLVPLVLLILSLTFLPFIPDSPRWLLANKTPAECLSSLRQLRRTNDVSREFNVVYRALSSDARLGDTWMDLLLSKSIRIRLLICVMLQIQEQLLGFQFFTSFFTEILQERHLYSPQIGLVLILCGGMLGTILFQTYVDDIGRRFLLLIGCGMVSLLWLFLTIAISLNCLQLDHHDYSSSVGQYFVHIFYFLLSFLYFFSISPVSILFIAEIFPARACAKASSLLTSLHYALSLTTTVILRYLPIEYVNNNQNCTIFFSIITTFVFIWTGALHLMVPDTKGYMLEEMEELFRIDVNHECLGCCPNVTEIRQNGPLGRRVLSAGSRIRISSLVHGGSNASKISTMYSSIASNGIDYSNHNGCEDENAEPILFEPSSLHKFSSDMQQTKFEYFQAVDEDRLVANFDMRTISFK